MAEWGDSWTGSSQTFSSSRGRGGGGGYQNRGDGGGRPRPAGGWEGGNSGSSEKIQVPSNMIARVIGRGGSKIRELEENTGCRIKVLKEESDADSSVILLSGDNIEEAKRLIMDIVEPSSGGGGFGDGGGQSWGGGRRENGSSNYDGNQPSEKMRIDSSSVARVIGRGGQKIRELEEKSGCRIRILKEESDGNNSYISISGSNIDGAKRLINQAIEPSDRQSYGNSNGGSYGNDASEKMKIDTSNVARVIGRGGQKIRELEERSGCRIRILKEESDSYDSYISISGSNIEEARKLINETIEPALQQSFGNMNLNGGSSDSEKMKIDTSSVARVIGRGGAKIRELEERSGCRIRILKEESDNYDSFISISGKNIEEAKALINETIGQ